jgi:hypothetical protein
VEVIRYACSCAHAHAFRRSHKATCIYLCHELKLSPVLCRAVLCRTCAVYVVPLQACHRICWLGEVWHRLCWTVSASRTHAVPRDVLCVLPFLVTFVLCRAVPCAGHRLPPQACQCTSWMVDGLQLRCISSMSSNCTLCCAVLCCASRPLCRPGSA